MTSSPYLKMYVLCAVLWELIKKDVLLHVCSVVNVTIRIVLMLRYVVLPFYLVPELLIT